jgi:hypothetical protein
VWVENRTSVFGMKLNANKPFMTRNFHDFYQIGFGIYSCGFHTGFLELMQVCVVKFEPVTVALSYGKFIVCTESIRFF